MKRLWLPLLPILLMVAGTAHATLIRPFSLQQLFREADLVVVGTVTSHHSFWNEARDTIYTEYQVAVERTEKGTARETLTVRLMGGRVGETELKIAGNPRLETGERVLLVLRDQGEFQTLVGLAQGKWSVRRLDGTDLASRGSRLTTPAREQAERPLDELLREMRPAPAE